MTMTDTLNFNRNASEILDCVLTEEEQRDRGRQLAESVEAVTTLEGEQATAKKAMKEALDSLESERGRLAVIVREGKEPRPVNVRHDFDDEKGLVHRYRMDTGELIASRPMTDTERQRALPFKSAKVN